MQLVRMVLFLLAVSHALPLSKPSTKVITEYVAVPSLTTNDTLHWTQVQYPEGVESADDVKLTPLNATVPALAAWYDLHAVFQCGNKIHGDKMYSWMGTPSAFDPKGQIPDRLRIYNREDASYRELPIGAIVTAAMPPNSAAYASHTFDVAELEGPRGKELYVFSMVSYKEQELNGTRGDAIVAFSTVDGTLLNTADGKPFFNIYKEAGETGSGQDWGAAVFKIQFFNSTSLEYMGMPINEEWHGNGVEHITLNDGTKILAFTHRMGNEAVLLSDPYSYTSAQGGGSIVQRFGTPAQYTKSTADYHYFGVKPHRLGFFSGGVHNVYYRNNSDTFPGKETISLFVNWASASFASLAVEFVINPKTQVANQQYDDSIFETEYVESQLSYAAYAEGGARAIGKGVFLTMAGIPFAGVAPTGLEVSDLVGNTHSYSHGNNTHGYDPFLFVYG